MDERLTRIRELINVKEKTDKELEVLLTGGDFAPRKPQKCSKCGQEGHTSRTCLVVPMMPQDAV